VGDIASFELVQICQRKHLPAWSRAVMYAERRRTFTDATGNASFKLRNRRETKWKTAPTLANRWRSPAPTHKVDVNSPKSMLARANLKSLINDRTLSLLSPSSQRQLLLLLPPCDRVLSPIDGYSLSVGAKALNNEFFSKSCVEWTERLSQGEFLPESRQLLRCEEEKEVDKLDEWKRRHFERQWGERRRPGSAARSDSCSRPRADRRIGARSSVPSRHRVRKEVATGDSAAISFRPKQTANFARFRRPGCHLGIPVQQHSLQSFQLQSSIDECSASADEDSANDLVETKTPETEYVEDVSRPCVINGMHSYYSVPNGDPFLERWAANGTVFGRNKCQNLLTHPPVHDLRVYDTERFTGQWENASVSDAGVSHGSRKCISFEVDGDHTYAKKAPTSNKLCLSEACAAVGGSPLARITILNAGSSLRSRKNQAASQPCLHKCTVTLSRLNAAIAEQQLNVKLRPLADGEKTEKCSDRNRRRDISGGSASLSSARDDVTVENNFKAASKSYLSPTNFGSSRCTDAQPCVDLLPLSDNSGLELLASVSSLTAERLQGPMMQRPDSVSDDTQSAACLVEGCRKLPHLTGTRVKVFCVRKKRAKNGTVSEQCVSPPLELLDIVRDFVAKGDSGPVCGTLPSQPAGRDVDVTRHANVSSNWQSEEIVCS